MMMRRSLACSWLFAASVVALAPPLAAAPLCPPTMGPLPPSWDLDNLPPASYGVGSNTYPSINAPSRPPPTSPPPPQLPLFQGHPGRSLPLTIWYPVDLVFGTPPPGLTPVAWPPVPNVKFPVLIHTHGFASNPSEIDYLAKFLAARGYIVVAAQEPLTNLGVALLNAAD